ncbi:MAG: hypothetical protein KIS78_29560 [Labilithrix sp.]|nr:hypothetical protein [Labilithrix sp.]
MTPLSPLHAPATSPSPSSGDALEAFTRSGSGPTVTFPLTLTAVTVSVLSMSLDAVPRYSHDAFFAGLFLTVVLAVVAGKTIGAIAAPSLRLVATLLVPTASGAVIGAVVQALVLGDVGPSSSSALRDLGGLVDTTDPVPWIASGIVLGGVPALLVSAFLVAASRSIRARTAHDAAEGFGVAFTGFAGLAAAAGLVLVDGISLPPLLFVAIASAVALGVALLVDGARLRFLRRVYAGRCAGVDVVPAERFARDPSLAPLVANAGAASMLVRVRQDPRSYRAAAAEPLALVGGSERETLRPLLRRRAAAAAVLVAMSALAGLAALAHA